LFFSEFVLSFNGFLFEWDDEDDVDDDILYREPVPVP
jgi:hypothetical protein